MLTCACCLSMSTVNATPGVCQSGGCCGDGGASGLSAALNAVGRWGVVVATTLQNKPVSVSKTGTLIVGTKGAPTNAPTKSNSGIIILVVIAVVVILLLSGAFGR